MPPSPDASRLGALGQTAVDVLTFALSLGGHLAVAVLVVAFSVVNLDLDSPGDRTSGPDAPVGNNGGESGGGALQTLPVPVRVSVYQPGAPKADDAEPTPKDTPRQPKKQAPATADDAEGTGGGEGDGQAKKEGVAGKPPRGNKKPCDPVEEITQLGPTKWRVERSLIDWYAVHLRELEKQAGVAVHKGDNGKRDGARLYLPRCSVLRQAGFRGGDVVHSVNGHKVSTIAKGVKTYAKVRNSAKLTVELTRKNGKQLTLVYKLAK